MAALAEHYTLSNGVRIPKIGFGTWQLADGDSAYNAVKVALQEGYRHIDTARSYQNEASVAQAITDSALPREDVFLTTKLRAEIKTYDEAHRSFAESLAALKTDYVDLYLIHAPWPWHDVGGDYRAGNAEAWRALEEIYTDGRARAIGVSNFTADDIKTLLTTASLAPQANQIEFYIGHTQPEVTAYCQANGILVEGYSPLATGTLIDNTEIRDLATRYKKSVAQLSIQYILQNGVLPLPKAATPSHIAENAVLDFTIDRADMDYLDALVDTSSKT